MTYPIAPATFPALTESVLGPILIGLATTPHDSLVIDEAWSAAAASVPMTIAALNVREGKTTVARNHTRRVLTGKGTDYLKLAQLCDTRKGESWGDSWQRGRWTVGARIVPDDGTRQFLGPGRTPIRVDVTTYRLRAGQVLEAPQLALFRHYVVAGFRALDPTAIVLGGQHDWHDGWWPTPDEAGQ